MRAVSPRLRRIEATLLFAVACLTAPASAAAQTPSVEPGNLVHVITVAGTDVRGRVARLDDRSITVVGSGDREQVVPRAEVDEILVGDSRVASYAKGGLLVGALGMGVTSAVVMSQLCSGSTDCGGEVSLGIAAGVAAGALAGALVGALVGAAATRWTPATPAEWGAAPSPVRLDLGLAGALAGGQPSVALSVALPLPR